MKFVCDSCHAQYMISDDKVGPNGVKVRCKKCSHVIVVKKVAEAGADPTIVMQNPLSGAATQPSADTPFGGLEMDEIGQAFDNVLSSGPHSSLPSTEENPAPDMAASGTGGTSGTEDRAATRVMDLAAMAGLATSDSSGSDKTPDAVKAGLGDPDAAAAAAGHTNGSAGVAAPIPQTDWYVAINEEQIGPLDLDIVKGHWEEGRLTTDSLVWRNGYPDWRPLSTVADLVKVLTPVPTKRKAPEPTPSEAPAGATASGPQVSWQATTPAPPPAAVPDPDEVDWKPAAASALASLVQDEMEALAKPPPKKEEPPPPEAAQAKGLLDILPEPPPPSGAASEAKSPDAPPATPKLDDWNPSPAAVPDPPRLAPSPRRVSLPPRVEPDIPVYPAPSSYVPPARENNNTKWIVIGLASVAGCATLITVVYLIVGRGSPQPAVVAENTPHAIAAPAETAPVPAPVTPPPAPTPPPVVAQPAAPAPTPPPAAPPPSPAPVVAAVKPAAAAAPVANAAPEREERHGKRHHRGEKESGAEVVASSEPPPERHQAAEAPAASASDSDVLSGAGKSKVDQDFDRLLGGGGGTKSDDAPAPKKAKGGSTYIPPPVGADLPDQLGKGDIMGVVAGHKDSIKICVQQQKSKDPDASGSMVMHWQIQPSGATTGVVCKTDEFKSGPMAVCMTNQIRSWKFPQFKGPAMPIDFPFKF